MSSLGGVHLISGIAHYNQTGSEKKSGKGF